MGDRIVEEWLRPLNLQHYTQAFLDNGYDDLEVCKQVGEPDLDAIGVLDSGHRRRILDAVEALRKEGEPAVYFTLENPDYASYACDQARSSVDAGAVAGRQRDLQSCLNRRSYFTYPRLQLTTLVQERLFDDGIHLNEPPYTDENGKADAETMQHLASRYADQLSVLVKDVLDRLEELRMAALYPDGSHSSETELEPESPGRSPYNMISVYGQSPRSAPPPLPPLSSMSCLYVDPIELEQNFDENCSPHQIPRSSLTPSTSTDPSNTGSELGSVASESSVKESVGNTLGRLFRSVTLRRPMKKYTYHQHEGDLNASDMMMSEDERIQLMILVKEGKLSIDEAVEMVKNHRREHQPMEDADSIPHDVKSSALLSSSCPTESVKSESTSNLRDNRSKIIFASPFSKWKGVATREPERLTRCFMPLLHRKKSEPFESNESPKIKSFGWSPPPLPPIPRNSGIIVESVSAECMAQYKSSSLKCSPLLTSKNGDVQPALHVRKSCSLHSSVPPQMALNCSNEELDDSTLRMRSHHYENVRRSDGQEIARMMSNPRNGVSFDPSGQAGCGEEWGYWAVPDEKQDPDGTLTNAGQKILTKPSVSEHKNEGMRLKGQNGHRSRTRRRQLKDREEPETSSTDSLTNAVASGVCGISSSSSHSSMSTEEEQIPKLSCINRVRAKFDYIPSPGDDLEALTLKKGDFIHLLGVLDSRWCRGILNNKIGTFRSTDVEPVDEEGTRLITPRHMRPCKGRRQQRRPKPKTVEELLHRLGLQHLTHLFLQHGFHTLDDFSELDEMDLNELKITNPEERVKLLTAAQLLLDTEQNEFDSCSRSASQSPALSHDASSQTVLTHFCARDSRSVVASISDGLASTPSSMNRVPSASSGHSGTRHQSETSSDDQEILSITENGTIVISWGENNIATFVASNSGVKMHPPGSGVSLSDSSISSGGDTASGGCHLFAGDASSASNRSFRHSTTSTQTGPKPLASCGRHCASEAQAQTIRCPEVALLRRVPAEGMHHEECDLSKRGFTCEKNGPLCSTSCDAVVPSIDNVMDMMHRKPSSDSSVFQADESTLVATRVSAGPNVKTAHVRQLVTSSPLHCFDSHIANLESQGSYANDLPLVLGDEDERNRLDERVLDSAAQNLLIKLGLSQYITAFTRFGVTTIEQLKQLDAVKLQAIGIENKHHVHLLDRTIDSLKHDARSSMLQASTLTDDNHDLQELEKVIETQVDPNSLGVTDLQNSRIASKFSSDVNCVSSKSRTTPRKSKIIDKV